MVDDFIFLLFFDFGRFPFCFSTLFFTIDISTGGRKGGKSKMPFTLSLPNPSSRVCGAVSLLLPHLSFVGLLTAVVRLQQHQAQPPVPYHDPDDPILDDRGAAPHLLHAKGRVLFSETLVIF